MEASVKQLEVLKKAAKRQGSGDWSLCVTCRMLWTVSPLQTSFIVSDLVRTQRCLFWKFVVFVYSYLTCKQGNEANCIPLCVSWQTSNCSKHANTCSKNTFCLLHWLLQNAKSHSHHSLEHRVVRRSRAAVFDCIFITDGKKGLPLAAHYPAAYPCSRNYNRQRRAQILASFLPELLCTALLPNIITGFQLFLCHYTISSDLHQGEMVAHTSGTDVRNRGHINMRMHQQCRRREFIKGNK